MPRPIGVIQKPGFFEDILVRFGINRPQAAFQLDGDVVPVILVDSAISFTAAATPAYNITDIFTAGSQVAPAALTVLADTGQLPVGPYTVQFQIECGELNLFLIQWRNAANSATLREMRIRIPIELGNLLWETRFNVENANERIRVLNNTAGGVGIEYQATILAKI